MVQRLRPSSERGSRPSCVLPRQCASRFYQARRDPASAKTRAEAVELRRRAPSRRCRRSGSRARLGPSHGFGLRRSILDRSNLSAEMKSQEAKFESKATWQPRHVGYSITNKCPCRARNEAGTGSGSRPVRNVPKGRPKSLWRAVCGQSRRPGAPRQATPRSRWQVCDSARPALTPWRLYSDEALPISRPQSYFGQQRQSGVTCLAWLAWPATPGTQTGIGSLDLSCM